MSKARAFVFTLNNYTIDDESKLSLAFFGRSTRYFLVGKEEGESKTKHLQGYVAFSHPLRFSTLTKLLPRAHIEAAKGTAEQNRVYCSKGGDFREEGELPKSPEKQGPAGQAYWANVLSMTKEGKMDELDAKIIVTQYRTLRAIQKDHPVALAQAEDVAGEWIYGTSGCGKSKYARETYPDAYIKAANTKWWDGYQGQKTVIIDDVDKFMVKLGYEYKIWLDRYPFQAEIKGGNCLIRPEKILITSQYSIDEIWQDEETRVALKRRCKVTNMTPMAEPVVVANEDEQFVDYMAMGGAH